MESAQRVKELLKQKIHCMLSMHRKGRLPKGTYRVAWDVSPIFHHTLNQRMSPLLNDQVAMLSDTWLCVYRVKHATYRELPIEQCDNAMCMFTWLVRWRQGYNVYKAVNQVSFIADVLQRQHGVVP